ncbi:hypothetical protein FQN54_001475 [Arachnomyces sp. PD_36]|nr:hypothetical protein FQN54_001475 [Arachnomyces sp. PD_36]
MSATEKPLSEEIQAELRAKESKLAELQERSAQHIQLQPGQEETALSPNAGRVKGGQAEHEEAHSAAETQRSLRVQKEELEGELSRIRDVIALLDGIGE